MTNECARSRSLPPTGFIRSLIRTHSLDDHFLWDSRERDHILTVWVFILVHSRGMGFHSTLYEESLTKCDDSFGWRGFFPNWNCPRNGCTIFAWMWSGLAWPRFAVRMQMLTVLFLWWWWWFSYINIGPNSSSNHSCFRAPGPGWCKRENARKKAVPEKASACPFWSKKKGEETEQNIPLFPFSLVHWICIVQWRDPCSRIDSSENNRNPRGGIRENKRNFFPF